MPRMITSHDVLEPSKQVLSASRHVIISGHILQLDALGDGWCCPFDRSDLAKECSSASWQFKIVKTVYRDYMWRQDSTHHHCRRKLATDALNPIPITTLYTTGTEVESMAVDFSREAVASDTKDVMRKQSKTIIFQNCKHHV